MILVLMFLWYCMDDWLAVVTATPWVGHVPLVPAFLVALVATAVTHRKSLARAFDENL